MAEKSCADYENHPCPGSALEYLLRPSMLPALRSCPLDCVRPSDPLRQLPGQSPRRLSIVECGTPGSRKPRYTVRRQFARAYTRHRHVHSIEIASQAAGSLQFGRCCEAGNSRTASSAPLLPEWKSREAFRCKNFAIATMQAVRIP